MSRSSAAGARRRRSRCCSASWCSAWPCPPWCSTHWCIPRPPAARWSSRCRSRPRRYRRHQSVSCSRPGGRAIQSAGCYSGSCSWGPARPASTTSWTYRMHHGTLPLGSLSVIVRGAAGRCSWPSSRSCSGCFPDGKLPAGRWRRPSVALLVIGLVITVTASLTGVLAVAEHDVHITANGRPDPPACAAVLVTVRRGDHRADAGRLAGLDRHPDPDLPPRRRRAPPAAQVAVQRGRRHPGRVRLRRVRDPGGHGPGTGVRQQSRDHRARHRGVRRDARQPGRGGAEVPAVRAGPDHQPGRLLHPDHGRAGGFLHRAGAADHARAAVQVGGGRGGQHADHRGAVQPAAAAGPAGGGPAVQPVPVQRRGRGGRVHRPDAADRGLRRRPGRPGRRGARGVPAHPGVDVAR